MESVLGRYRNLTILVGVLFLQVLALAVQVKRSADAENSRLIRIWAVEAITPFERGLVWAQSGTGNIWHNYFFLRGVRAENRQLKEQIEQMRLEQVRLSEDATQAHRLQSLLAFKEQFISKTVAAQVIGSSASDTSRIVYIDKGDNAHLERDMAVITADGIVGKVLQVFPSVSQVLMINDSTSGVGVMLEKSRLQGVLSGTPNGEVILQRVMSDEQVSPGETVLTSGGDQIFPKGLPVGTVSKVSPGREMFLSIKVKPAADLSRLEEVLVVTEKQEREAVAQGAGRVRAADILAQRLPSVPDQPAAVAVPAENGTTGESAGAKPQPNDAGKAATGAGTKVAGGGGAPGASAPVGNKTASPGAAHTATVSGEPATGDVLKKVVQKVAAGDSGASGASHATPNATPNSNPNSANPPAKAQPKASDPQTTPQPATSDDGPH